MLDPIADRPTSTAFLPPLGCFHTIGLQSRHAHRFKSHIRAAPGRHLSHRLNQITWLVSMKSVAPNCCTSSNLDGIRSMAMICCAPVNCAP